MKNLIALVALALLLMATHSCGVIKNKRLEKTKTSEIIKNDIAVSKIKIDSSMLIGKSSKHTESLNYTEELNIKKANTLNNIEITAVFRIDTNATLSGDTALKLVDMNNNGVSLSIFQNSKTKQMMAKVTTPKGSQVTDFSEITLKRKSEGKTESQDSLNFFENHSELKDDSLDKTEIEKSNKSIVDHKTKDVKSNVFVWLGLAVVIAFFVWLGFRRK